LFPAGRIPDEALNRENPNIVPGWQATGAQFLFTLKRPFCHWIAADFF
jgi:hypothetical protein